MKIHFLNIAMAITALTFTMTSCNKDDYYNLDLEIDYKVGAESFVYDQVYTINGTAVKFSLVQFYVSGIHIEDHDGAKVNFDKYLLVKPSQTNYELGPIAKDFGSHLHELNFNVGIDEATNSQTTETFTSRAATDPLSTQNPAMHWSWNSGYIFIKMEGMVDTDGDGTPDAVAEWHLGMNSMLRPVGISAHSDLSKGKNEIHLNFDVAKLFTDVDLATEYDTHTMDNMPLAVKIADNVSSAFSKVH